MRSRIEVHVGRSRPTVPAVMPNPIRLSGPACQSCMVKAIKAAHIGQGVGNSYSDRWLQYACELFLLATEHTQDRCTNTVNF